MEKTKKPTNDLQKLFTPATGRELDELVTEMIGESSEWDVRDTSATPVTPMFLQAAQVRADARGITVDRLLGDYSARLKASHYPTLDCLSPEDVQRVSEGNALSDEQREHISSCEPCRNLLAGTQLSADRRKALMGDLRVAAENQTGSPEVFDDITVDPDETAPRVEDLMGTSEATQLVLRQVQSVARSDAAVLVQGETGTGKGLVARAIYELSPRSMRPLVTVNCAAMPSELLEDELFGHEKGAFSGATTRKLGLLEQADGGTLFLNEIAEVPLAVQNRLLHVLQGGELKPSGSDRPLRVNVRLIAATNRDLQQMVAQGAFREDLYYRINAIRIHVPPLRDRLEDVPILVRHFIAKHQWTLQKRIVKVPREVIDQLEKYSWPGNVRELENVIERALLMSSGESLTLRDLPAQICAAPSALGENLFEVERRLILNALDAAKWKTKGSGSAADALGMTPEMLRWRMNRLGIKDPSLKERTRA